MRRKLRSVATSTMFALALTLLAAEALPAAAARTSPRAAPSSSSLPQSSITSRAGTEVSTGPVNFAASSTSANTITEFPIPNSNSGPFDIAGGPDGNLWFTGGTGIGRITTTGAITGFPIPTANGQLFDPAIVAGPDGNLWFTELYGNSIGRITTAGVITEFPITTGSHSLLSIAAGPDGNLWFTDGQQIGRITTAGAITEFLIPTANGVFQSSYDIAAGPDGNLWFTESYGNNIGRITPAGVISEFAGPPSYGIAAGPDGNVWFTEQGGGKIGRITPTGVITEFPPQTATSGPAGIAAGPDGNLWFAEQSSNHIGRITPAGVISEFAVAGIPGGIAAGPDGSLWFTEVAEIGRVNPAGTFSEFPIPSAGHYFTGSPSTGIAAGADGNLWFTETGSGRIGRITTAGVISEFAIPTANASPDRIGAGPDGNMWFTEYVPGNPNNIDNIGRITPTGTITEFPLPTVNSSLGSIVAGPDGNLWFTESVGKIGRITTAGVVTEFATPTAPPPFPPSSWPDGITAGPDGNLWFTELVTDKVGRITPAGVITEFSVPTPNSTPSGIAAGADGNLWFTESSWSGTGATNIGQITPNGVITELPTPTANSLPVGIAAGPDGNIWFTEESANKIGRITLGTGLGAPGGVRVVAGDGEATLTWTPPPNTGPAITGYTVTASPGGATTTISPLVPAATVTGLTNGTPYTFTVAATNAVGTGPASAPTAAVTPTAVAQASLVAVLPAMSNNAYGGYLTTAYIENVSGSAAHVRVQYFNTSGQGAGFGNSVAGLAPGASWTLRTDNGHSLAAAQPGFADVYSDQPVAVFVNEFAPGGSDATSYTSISNPVGTGSTLFAPAIANGAYGGYTTGIGLVNLATSAVTITVTYRDSAGTVVKTQTLTGVPAGAYQGLYSGTAGLPAAFAGTATITNSGGSLAAVVNETGPGGQFSSYDAVPVGSMTLYAPAALSNAFGGYNTGMGIQNTTGTAGTVTVTYYDNAGTPTAHNFAIGANGYLGIYQGTDIAAGAYTAKITSTVAVSAIVNEVAPSTNPAVQQSTAYDTFSAGSASLHLPLVESAGADGWSTGDGIMNTGTAATTVTVTYYDAASGLQVGTPDSLLLQPNAFWGLYQPAGGLPSGDRASATVTTTAGGQVAVICNESNATSFMSYTAQ